MGDHTVRINDQVIAIRPKETILAAALRSGIDFPNSCRVGGCATCKCRVVDGEVKQRTETSYLLSAEELDRGYVLACQSVPRGDVRVEVALPATSPRIAGRVVEQVALTHDLTRLTIQLDLPLAYRAGQFAQLRFAGLPGVVRSYSFATPARADGTVVFCVRKVPGGACSTYVHDRDLRGERVEVDGPRGDFWLRPDDAPLVMIAGGSGLPPLLAMLQEAAAAGVRRPVTLLFGARTQRDLYALEEIEALRAAWPGLRFIPVLSAADDDASWTGARGLVTDAIPADVGADVHAYLCGPPAMVDAAAVALRARGVREVHADRFTTLADGGLPPARASASASSLVGALHYLKYFGFHAIGVLALLALLAGGATTTAALILVVAAYIVGDALGGDDVSTPQFRHPGILTAQLWLALPLLAAIVFTAVWSVSPGDPLGYGAWVGSVVGVDLLAARDAAGWGHHVAAWLLTGLMIGMVGTIPAHELTHRTWDRVSMMVGRWLLAFSFDTSFAIEHVYGHHRYVSTTEDPATAPRGRNVYFHVLSSTVRGNVSAWHIERERLAKRHRGPWSVHNAFLRGHLLSVLLVLAAFALGGAIGAGFFVACALWGKALLEIINYVEHYGLVRDPATPVQPRHSWNTNRRMSSWTLFNLTRHSHHHAQGEVPYQDLRPYPDAPMMVSGYLTTLVIAMIPPLWHALMTPKVLAWDRDHATAEERALAAAANQRSRQPGFDARSATA